MFKFITFFARLILSILAISGLNSCSKETPTNDEVAEETIGAWTNMNKSVTLPGWEDLYCFEYADRFYALFQDGSLYSFNMEALEVVQENNFPGSGNTGTKFNAVNLQNVSYIFNSIDNKLYRFEDGKWTVHCDLPFYYDGFGGYYQGLTFSNSLYLLSSNLSYRYIPETNEWFELAEIPDYYESEDHMTHIVYAGYTINGTVVNNKAYVISSVGDIFCYNPESDNWEYITKYPGVILDRIVCFSSDNKIYFGLSHIDHSPSYFEKWLENELWSYDLSADTWNEEEKIPFELPPNECFYFQFNDKLYFGYAPLPNYYQLYRFDPS
jgi:N-acetylneuraminic acid mutarotase